MATPGQQPLAQVSLQGRSHIDPARTHHKSWAAEARGEIINGRKKEQARKCFKEPLLTEARSAVWTSKPSHCNQRPGEGTEPLIRSADPQMDHSPCTKTLIWIRSSSVNEVPFFTPKYQKKKSLLWGDNEIFSYLGELLDRLYIIITWTNQLSQFCVTVLSKTTTVSSNVFINFFDVISSAQILCSI